MHLQRCVYTYIYMYTCIYLCNACPLELPARLVGGAPVEQGRQSVSSLASNVEEEMRASLLKSLGT